MSYLSNALALRAAMDKAGEHLTDAQALEAKAIYPTWLSVIGQEVAEGKRLRYGDKLYTVRQAHTVQEIYPPGMDTAALYAEISDSHSGTVEDPIPYDGNMELSQGLYYSQDSVIYLCTRSSGQPLYHALADLVGLYVEVYSGGVT